MGLILACKAFVKALKNKDAAQRFIDGKAETPKKEAKPEPTHLRMLALLQSSGRLIDFLKEDISSYSDAQVGAAVRQLHEKCQDTLEDCVSVRPVMEDPEGSKIQVPKGYDPSKIKLVGAIKGDGPYSGKLTHRGWQASQVALPKKLGEQASEVLCPAEVEVH